MTYFIVMLSDIIRIILIQIVRLEKVCFQPCCRTFDRRVLRIICWGRGVAWRLLLVLASQGLGYKSIKHVSQINIHQLGVLVHLFLIKSLYLVSIVQRAGRDDIPLAMPSNHSTVVSCGKRRAHLTLDWVASQRGICDAHDSTWIPCSFPVSVRRWVWLLFVILAWVKWKVFSSVPSQTDLSSRIEMQTSFWTVGWAWTGGIRI